MTNSQIAASTRIASFVDLYDNHEVYSAFERETRSGGTFGLKVIEIRQGAVETVDPAIPEYAFVSNIVTSCIGETNFGDGWKKHDFSRSMIDVQPANTSCMFRLPALHMQIATVPDAAFVSLLDESSLTPAALDGVMGAFQSVPEAARLIDAIWRAASAPSPATNLLIDGAFLQLTAHLLAAAGQPPLALPAAIGDVRLARALDYLETHIDQPLTVGALAQIAAMSTSAFSRAFQAAMGRPVWEHVQHRRLERAREMVVATKVPLVQIALDCGFSDASHLSRLFRRRYGMTATEMRGG